MQTKRFILVAVSVLVAIGLGFMIGSRRHSSDLMIPVVKTYMVPVDRTEEIKTQINKLIEGGVPETNGRAQVFSNGLMIVRAPEGFQRGIGQLIEQLEKVKSLPRQTVHIDCWIVTGQEDKVSNAESIAVLALPLAAIAKLDGPRKFHVLEHFGTNSISGQETKIKGAVAEVISTPFLNGEGLSVKMDIRGKLGELKSDAQAKQGEFLILGQNSADSLVKDGKINNGSMNVYYILRADLSK
ncbi:MAG: hypothetical protein ACXVA9_02225 [Bdellovibrionales bacterium]